MLNGAPLTNWRVIHEDGFTFCLPNEWSGKGSRWHRGNASIDLGSGSPPLHAVRETAAGPAGAEPEGAPNGSSDSRSFSEQIDGRRAKMWEYRADQTYYTGAAFERDKIYLEGQANDRGAADITLNVFRTVRFLPPS